MKNDNGPPPHAQVMMMVNGMLTARCIVAAAELAIADKLGERSMSVEDLAAEVGEVDAAALYRALRLLAGFGVFRELPERHFENSVLSSTLRADSPNSVRAICKWLGHPLHWQVVGDLDYSLRTGAPALKKHHPDSSPLDVLFADESARACFGEAMAEVSAAQHGSILKAYDFSAHSHITDVGGGHGAFAALIADSAPKSLLTVFDLPPVAAAAKEALRRNPNPRIDVKAGSFLDAVPGPTELCVLKWVLHLWQDDVANRVLRNCHSALTSGGHILVVEMVVESGPQGGPARIMDLEMLCATGGRERTEDEFRHLLSDSGFELTRVIPTPAPVRLIEAKAV